MIHGSIAVDLDGTLAHYVPPYEPGKVGEPIYAMAKRVEAWLEQGVPVKIFTARVWTDGSPERDGQAILALAAIQRWCQKHFGVVLPVTCVKDPGIIEIWDDRAVAVERNTGAVLGRNDGVA